MSVEDVRAACAAVEDIKLPNTQNSIMPFNRNAPLKPRASQLLSAATWSANIEPNLERDYLIKGWLEKGTLSVVFGPSNVGKSFLAIDLAHHISKGRTWNDRRVKKANVLYLIAEGAGGFSNRVAALDDPEFWVLPVPLTLAGKTSDAVPLSEMIQHLAGVHGDYDLIIVDTLSRVMGSGDENAAPDIADLIKNLDQVRDTTGANVLLVHHTGKDLTRGARGHSSLRAAIDTEIELSRDEDGIITAEITKQRDGPTGVKFDYTLRQVELGKDQDGDPVTTCLVEPAMSVGSDRVVLNGPAKAALDILDELLMAKGEVVRKPKYPGSNCIPHSVWMETAIESGELSTSDKRETHRRIFNRVVTGLLKKKVVILRDDLVWKVEND